LRKKRWPGVGFQDDLTAVPGWPAQLLLVDAGGRRVDLHVVVFDGHGNGWQELGGGAWGGYPAEGLTGVGMVGGRQVRCLTPQLQVRHHLGYPLGATDRHDLGLLAERFGVAVPPAIQPSAGGYRPDRSSDRPWDGHVRHADLRCSKRVEDCATSWLPSN
jgi:hypothetical protein